MNFKKGGTYALVGQNPAGTVLRSNPSGLFSFQGFPRSSGSIGEYLSNQMKSTINPDGNRSFGWPSYVTRAWMVGGREQTGN